MSNFIDEVLAIPRVWGRGERDGEGETVIADFQRRLTAAGFPLNPDGVYGPATERAVRAYQKSVGLVPDGRIGPKTLAALDRVDTSRLLGDQDIQRAAGEMGVSVAAVLAVNEVESRGNGFLPNGRPVILFERHIMHRLLRRKGVAVAPLVAKHPGLVNPTPGGYRGGAAEHARLIEARRIDDGIALQSASWGLFQIMGFHYALLGFDTPQEMVAAAQESEGRQLDMFVAFVKAHPPMHQALIDLDWAEFARRYNGPAYAKNRYDTRMAAAFDRHQEAA